MAEGCPCSAAVLTIRREKPFVFLREGSALLTEETALQATRATAALGDHLIIHASCN